MKKNHPHPAMHGICNCHLLSVFIIIRGYHTRKFAYCFNAIFVDLYVAYFNQR
jgi:hypothetical protein